MFKIESYVTPIILNYVAKYVKNIRPQDAQVSLWEGEAVFQNLDLRLDVLEEELNLPFEFLSGHIHELSIHVPWTKITSEPIRIDINTIEFVLKLKDDHTDGASSSTSSSPQRCRKAEQRTRRSARLEDSQQQPPSGSGLANKIINNIALQCHNIILKYVEEDIVVSMNVQLLSFGSADDQWRTAMVDVHPVRAVMRKLVQISDFTICLDKRNAAGQIDVCQEPLLYRCSLECRILRKYNLHSMATSSTTRIAIRTKSMDMNVSALQFPMAMRLFHLILALKLGKFKCAPSSDVGDETGDELDSATQSEGSYLSWAWNLLPSFNFPSAEEEEVQAEVEAVGHFMDIGVYIEQFQFTLKNSEFLNDSIMGTAKRIRYTPIMRVSLAGVFFESVGVQEQHWSSVKAGITSIQVEPLGAYRSEEKTTNPILETAAVQSMQPFVKNSLFDEHYTMADRCWGSGSYMEYATHITDEYLLYRAPVVAFDLIEYKQSNGGEESTSALVGDDKSSDIRVQYRLLSSGLTIRYCHALLQVKHVISDFIETYDYPAYHAERLDAAAGVGQHSPKLHPPVMEDYDALMKYIPLRTYKFDVKNIRMEFYSKMEPEIATKTHQRRISLVLKASLPYYSLYFSQLEGTLSTPIDAARLVHTTCQLPEKPAELLAACYNNFQFSLKDFTVSLVESTAGIAAVRLVNIPKLQINVGQLLHPELWRDEEIALRKLDLSCEKFLVEFSKIDFIRSERLLMCTLSYRPALLAKLALQPVLCTAANRARLQNEFIKLRVQNRNYKQHNSWSASLRGLQSAIILRQTMDESRHLVFLSTAKMHHNQQKWLEWQAQFPLHTADSKKDPPAKTFMGFWIERYQISMDVHLVNFLAYQEQPEPFSEKEANVEVEIQTQILQPPPNAVITQPLVSQYPNATLRRAARAPAPPRKISHPEETIHVSSERDDKFDLELIPSAQTSASSAENMAWIQYAETLIFTIEIAQGRLEISQEICRGSHGLIANEYTEIVLPRVSFKSTHAEFIVRSNVRQKIVVPAISTLNWNLGLHDMAIRNSSLLDSVEVLEPLQTTITIALTHKQEKLPQPSKVHSTAGAAKKNRFVKNRTVADSQAAPQMTQRQHEDTASISADGRTDSDNELEHEDHEETFEKRRIDETIDKSTSSLKEPTVKDTVSLTLHADTTPVHFHISAEKAKILHDHLNVFLKIVKLSRRRPHSNESSHKMPTETVRILTGNEEDAKIKEFLELETNSDASKATDYGEQNKLSQDTPVVATYFCQWTVAKVIVELETSALHESRSKIIVDFEDLLASVVIGEDYTKYTGKIGSYGLTYHQPNQKKEWQRVDYLRMRMFGEAANMPFLNFILTTVGLKIYYNRIGAKKMGDLSRNISEVVVTVQAIEIIMDLDRMTDFVRPLCVLFDLREGSVSKSAKQVETQRRVLSAAELPMVHLDCKGFVLYMPLETHKSSCSVMMWKIEGIKVTPDLQNPLQRNPLRPDVYSKATQIGILNAPGGMVEDRQYELVLQNISAATGDWNQIQTHMREQDHHSLHANPAFQWNHHHNRKPSLQLTDLFNNFKFIAIYAPDIVYHNILICGQALEFNCASDFICEVNTMQLHLLSCLCLRFQNILDMIRCSVAPAEPTPLPPVPTITQSDETIFLSANSSSRTMKHLARSSNSFSSFYSSRSRDHKSSLYMDARNSASMFGSIDEDIEQNFKSDSGFLSGNSRYIPSTRLGNNRDRRSSSSSSIALERYDYVQLVTVRQPPQTVSFIAGIFILNMFELKEKNNSALSADYEKHPLLSITISQPSFITTKNVYDSITQFSLFDLNVHMSSLEEVTLVKQSPKANLFPVSLLETRAGEVSAAGIPPALISIKAHRTKMQLLEIDADILRPMLFKLSEEHANHLCEQVVHICDALLENPCFELRCVQPVARGSKIRLMREQFFMADRLHFNCQHLAVKFSDQKYYNCKLFCTDIKLNLKFLNRPEKASVKGAIGAFYMQTGQKMFIHPISMRYSIDFTAEPWSRLPLVIASMNFNAVRVHISISALLQLRETLEGLTRVSNVANAKWQRCLGNHLTMSPPLVMPDQLTPLKCPLLNVLDRQRPAKKKNKLDRTELYQDDLRAGAFQFVELPTDSFLPLPYQIQIIKKNYGIICWRYPQPRKMTRVHIYPVPMAVSTPVQIKCRMEYFSEVHEGFLHYCDFWLSETASKDIDLPERDISSTIWRVIIMQSLVAVNGECFDTSEEDEDLCSIASSAVEELLKKDSKPNEFILDPKALVGCMRVDTTFDSKSVPKVQLLVSCNQIEVKLLNQPNENVQLPPLLQKFRLSNVSSISQTFLAFELTRVCFHAIVHSLHNYSLDTNLSCHITCLDYGYMNMLNLLEPTTFQTYVCLNRAMRTLTTSMVIDSLHLNFGPSIVHTLVASKMHWDELLERQRSYKKNALISKCIVVNRTMSHMSFGQSGTTERIHLQPKECHMYSFRSDFHNQELTFFVADEMTHITEVSQSIAIPLKFSGQIRLQSVRIGNKCIIVKSQKLSGSQIFVLIKGQIELLSMVPQELRVEFCRDAKTHADRQLQEFQIEGNGRSSFYRSVHRSSNIIMRLKFANIKGKGRSGDIPLRANKNLPWLVKVPTANDFVSFWVRIIREDITEIASEKFQPQKLLITIWPIFVISSMLSCPIEAVDKETGAIMALQPQGGRLPLNVAATHLTEHQIDLHYGFTTGPATPKNYTLTLQTMALNTFFWYDEQVWNCDYALQELARQARAKWPITDEEELRVRRITHTTTHADAVLQCKPTHEFSCSFCLEISPWAMFINASGICVTVHNCDTRQRTKIDANGLEMLFAVDRAFTVDIEDAATNWNSSLPIYYDQTKTEGQNGRFYLVQEKSVVDIVIRSGKEVMNFVLEMKVENGRKIFKLSPKFVITNYTERRLSALPFAMDHKESATREDVMKLDSTMRKFVVEPTKGIDNSIGFALDLFYDLNNRKAHRSNDTAFVCFVCLKYSNDSSISIPIPLAMSFTRRCFSLQSGNESIPILASLIERSGIYYLSLFQDISPGLLVDNRTDVEFIIAQTTASEHSKVTNTTPEYDGKHFEWFQILPAHSNCYYTPPEMYASFPDVESTMCNLTLAMNKENKPKKDIKWSKPIRTDKSWEKFLHVPHHGDVKVIICDKHRVIRVSIFYIAQQLEFSVKDLRSRILTQVPNVDPGPKQNKTPAIMAAAGTELRAVDTPTCSHFHTDSEGKLQWKLRFFAKEIMLNLHTDDAEKNHLKCVVLSMYLDDMLIAYDNDDDERQLNVLISNLQIDNQMHATGKYDFPVILCAQELYTRTMTMPQVYFLEQMYQHLRAQELMVQVSFTFFQDELKIDSFRCQMSPVRAYVEDAYLNDFLDALLDCDPCQCVYRPKTDTRPMKLIGGEVLIPREVVAEAVCFAEPLQLRSFRIEPLNVLLSVHTSVRLYIALDHSPLSFSTYERTKVLTVPLRFGQSVGMHFLSGAIFGAGWVVGSLEILGSPSGLARSFTTGLKDFVSMPVQGLFRGPWGFVVGITQGSASLLRNVTAGTVNSVTKLAASVARNLDRLSLDAEHIERTEALRRSRPRGFAEGFSQGMTGLGISLLGAVGGLAHHTLEARSPFEIMTGMGKGLVGAFTKPLSGAAELLALTGQGMLHTVGFNTMPMQRSTGNCPNMAFAPAAYRIWKLLPAELITDQILFYYEVTLNVQEHMRRAYVFLTSAVFAILEAQWDRLVLVLPLKKVEMTCDRDDKSLFYVHVVKETDDVQEDASYTNQRIMSFLRSSFSVVGVSAVTTDSLEDLLQAGQDQARHRRNWSFYMNADLGDHLMQYLNIIKKNHH